MKLQNLIEFVDDFENDIHFFYREDIHRCSWVDLKEVLEEAVPTRPRLEIVPYRFEVLIKIVGVGGIYFRLSKKITSKALYSYFKVYGIAGGLLQN